MIVTNNHRRLAEAKQQHTDTNTLNNAMNTFHQAMMVLEISKIISKQENIYFTYNILLLNMFSHTITRVLFCFILLIYVTFFLLIFGGFVFIKALSLGLW